MNVKDNTIIREGAEPLAIVGYAVRYPQDATDAEHFWEFLLQARQSSTPFPADRINSTAFYHPDPNHGGTFHAKGAHFLRHSPIGFDAAFFKMSKTEVLSLDPQHRLVMENVYHALENAGIPMEQAISTSASVYINGYNHDHADNINTDPETILKYKPTGTENALISGRVSWFYDFHGPSLTVETACSGSLVGLHLACQSLKTGESDMAIVSGVNVIAFLPHMTAMSYSGFVGAEGKCFAFDHRADGYARGEGVGTVIVKRLSNALQNGDTVRAIIRGTGLNQDGRTPGITYPSLSAQKRLIQETYRRAGLSMANTCFIESHGTGTQAGDFVEASAIHEAFETATRDLPLYIGALKTNIGHLEGGSGIAGLIKTIRVLETGIIPPNVNLEKSNPKIPFDEWNLSLPTRCERWPTSGPRRASVSCFGLSGTNSHCILDDAHGFLKAYGVSDCNGTKTGISDKASVSPDVPSLPIDGDEALSPKTLNAVTPKGLINGQMDRKGGRKLVFLSGFDEHALLRYLPNLSAYIDSKLSTHDSQLFSDLAFTLSEKRTHFAWRACHLADSIMELRDTLSDGTIQPHYCRSPPQLGFVFTGQGAQYAGMGRQLLSYKVYRESLEDANRYFQQLGSTWSLLDELNRGRENTRIHEPAVAHPSSTAIQIALVDLLKSWGIYPSRVIGHSSGEIAAAYSACKISREAAWRVAYFRGQVVYEAITHPGSMMAVGLSMDDTIPYLQKIQDGHPNGVLTIACFNSPKNQTVSGDTLLIDALKDELDRKHIFARKLNVGNAYHSSHMSVFTNSYQSSMGSLEEGLPQLSSRPIAMFSTFTGKEVLQPHLDASYWCSNMVSPVRFEEALQALCYTPNDDGALPGVDEILEIGAHGSLRSAIKECMDSEYDIKYAPVLDRNVGDTRTTLETAARLVTSGYPVNIFEVNHAEDPYTQPKLLIDLPPYCFDHDNRVIHESRLARNLRLRKFPRHDIFGAPVQDWDPRYPRWRHFLRLAENPWLKQYRIKGQSLFPPAGYIAMAIESSHQIANKERVASGFHLEQFKMNSPIFIPECSDGIEISLSQTPIDHHSSRRRFSVSSYNEHEHQWTEHCSGYITIQYEDSPDDSDLLTWQRNLSTDLEHLRSTNFNQCQKAIDFESFSDGLGAAGLELGTLFHNFTDLNISGTRKGTSASILQVPDIQSMMPQSYIHEHILHPVTLDGMFQSAIIACQDLNDSIMQGVVYVPSEIQYAWVSSRNSPQPGTEFQCSARAETTGRDCFVSDVQILSKAECTVIFRGLRLQPFVSEDETSALSESPIYHSIEWQPDIHLLSNSFFQNPLETSIGSSDNYEAEREWFTDLQLATTLLSTDALLDMKGVDPSALEPHYQRFYELLKHIAADILTDSIPNVPFATWQKYAQSPALKKELFRRVEACDSDGALLMKIGLRISSFFRKEADPLQIMFGQDDLMTRYYNDDFEIGNIPLKLNLFLNLLRWNQSSLRVLEVGGGTGSFTAKVLAQLCPRGLDSAVSEYTFTDLSPGFFEKAKERLGEWKDVMSYKKFDVGIDPSSQGFEPGSFDMVIASNVLHATPEIHATLKNIHYLLKAGGKLVFHEGVRQDTLWTNISFSPLSGWWLGVEPERRWCPYISTSSWDTYLRKTGFSGLDLEFPSSKYPEFSKISVMVSTAENRFSEKAGAIKNTDVVVCVSEQDKSPLAETLGARLSDHGFNWTKHTLAEIDTIDLSDKICLSMLETDRDFLMKSSSNTFDNVRSMLEKSRGSLWVTKNSEAHPTYDISTGIIRSLRGREEVNGSNLVVFSISDTEHDDEEISKSLLQVFAHQFTRGPPSAKNAEYLLRDGIILTNRIVPNKDATSSIEKQLTSMKDTTQAKQDVQPPLRDIRPQSRNIQSLAKTVAKLLQAQNLPPGLSDQAFTYSQLQDAVRLLDIETGVNRIAVRPSKGQSSPHCTKPTPPLDKKGSYVLIGIPDRIVGQVAFHLASRGAKNIVVLTQEPVAEMARLQGAIEALQSDGCTVHAYQHDADKYAESQISHYTQKQPPIKGILCYSSAVDGSRQEHAKSKSAHRNFLDLINIHETFTDIDILIMFVSSQVDDNGPYGDPISTVQDAVARQRASVGRRAGSINITHMSAQEIISTLDYAIDSQRKTPGRSIQLIGNLQSPASYQERNKELPKYLSQPLFLRLPVSHSSEKSATIHNERRESMRDLLENASDASQAAAIVSGQIRRKLSNLLNVTEDEIRETNDIRTNGVDSLIEMEFQNWLDRELSTQIPVEDLTTQSISKLSVQVVSSSPLAQFG